MAAQEPITLGIIGGTGLGALPSPPFEPVSTLPLTETPWGTPSAPITILAFTPPSQPSRQPIKIAFLARHGNNHSIAPHEVNNRANVAALKKIGARAVVGFSAVGSLQEEVKPRDFVVAGGIVDWTKGVRPWTFFEDGVVGHVSMADPYDKKLSEQVYEAIRAPGVLQGDNLSVHSGNNVICIEGPQFSTRAESILYRSFRTEPPISCINMTAMPEAKLFREAEIAYSLICMSTDYDSWHATNEGVSVEMVMGHMAANGQNAKRAVEAIVSRLMADGQDAALQFGQQWHMASRGGIMGLSQSAVGKSREAIGRLEWLFGSAWIQGTK